MTRFLDMIIHYWPLAVIFITSGFVIVGMYLIAVVITNRRWAKAIHDGKYVSIKTRALLVHQRQSIRWQRREIQRVKAERDDLRQRLLQIHTAINRQGEI